MVSVELSDGFSVFGTHESKYLTHLQIIGFFSYAKPTGIEGILPKLWRPLQALRMVSVELSAGFSVFGTHTSKYLTHPCQMSEKRLGETHSSK
jgi:hypothetical protein